MTDIPAILVVAAHAGDFVWRCGGTIAKYTARGSRVRILILSDGLRGEANDYWKRECATEEEGRTLRRAEATKAADLLGTQDIVFYGLADYPIEIGTDMIEEIGHQIRAFRPDVILTHASFDAFNPDHNEVHAAVRKACAAASGAGFPDSNPVGPRQIPLFGFEPQMTEISEFEPSVYVDISDAFAVKEEAMYIFATQPGMFRTYVRKAETRGAEDALRGSRPGCRYAECFESYQPIGSSGDLVW